MELSLALEGHPILRQPCEPWEDQEDATELVKAMMRIMLATNGIGLAAPQVGRNYRMFIMGNSHKTYACFNPRILAASHESIMDKEGCLSFPGLWLNIRRHSWIDAEYEDVQGNTQTHRFEGMMARCYQHELDHLDGKCFTDHAAKLSLKMARERQTKWLKKGI
jgi:peptide deformylase